MLYVYLATRCLSTAYRMENVDHNFIIQLVKHHSFGNIVEFSVFRLKYQVETKSNVEYISKNGRFPVLVFNEKDIVSGFSELVEYLNK